MRMYILILIVIVFGWFVFNQIGSGKLKDHRLTAAEFKDAIVQKDMQLLDVRTASEFKSGHIKNAKHMDVLSITKFLNQIKSLNKEQPIYLYCRSGQRSQKALKILLKQGFTQVYDLKGGYVAWQQQANAKN